MAVITARHVGLPQEAMEHLAAGCLLSEIGSSVDAKILRTTDELDQLQQAQVNTHIKKALKKLEGANLPLDILLTIRYHHERFNGAGQLAGRSG